MGCSVPVLTTELQTKVAAENNSCVSVLHITIYHQNESEDAKTARL